MTRTFFRRDAESLARALLGRHLVRVLEDGTRLVGRIVETEAYLGAIDKAAHTYGGRRTARNESMYLDAGCAYVYFTYGMHHCMNISADGVDVPTACLIRALEPMEGLDHMRRHRAGKIPIERLKDLDLCRGPARLTQALRIDRSLDGEDLVRSERMFLEAGQVISDAEVVVGPRIGIGYAEEWIKKPLRFLIRGCTFVSAGV